MLDLSQIENATGGCLVNHQASEVGGFSIDSRTITEGEFFIPLPGSRTDGHRFLRDAFEKGAAGALVNSKEYIDEDYSNLIVVEDTEQALLDMARCYRTSFDIPTVGVTGSWGKTTTKELIFSILSTEGRVHKSPGNYNTEYGLPLAILEMEEDVEFAVFELGLQYPGDLETLSKVLIPTHGLVTGAGRVHLENFHDVEEVAREKLKITEGMTPGSKVLINGDSSALRRESRNKEGFNFYKYGIESERYHRYYASDLKIKGIQGLEFRLNLNKKKGDLPANTDLSPLTLETELTSMANVYNALAAASLSLELGLERPSIMEGVHLEPLPQRLEPKPFARGTVIDDTYNANPAATRNALELLANLRDGRKFFVFGDMMELGDESSRLHRDLATQVRSAGVGKVLAVGQFTKALVDELNTNTNDHVSAPEAEWFESKDSLIERLEKVMRGEDNLILVKGSRSMEMEKVVDYLVYECN